MKLEIHGEERNLFDHVLDPEALVELDAVEDAHGIGGAYRVKVQIPVAIHDAALAHPSRKHGWMALEEQVGGGSDEVEDPDRNERAHVLLGLREVLVAVAPSRRLAP